MKYLYLVICTILFFSCNNNKATEKKINVERENFLDNKPIDTLEYEFSTASKFALTKNFVVRKIIFNDKSFDFSILCTDTSNQCSIRLVKENKNWNVWNGNNWDLLFDNDNTNLKKVTLNYADISILPLEKYISTCDTLYSFRIWKESSDINTDGSIYFFSPKDGIVAVDNGVTYLRNDFEKKGKRKETLQGE